MAGLMWCALCYGQDDTKDNSAEPASWWTYAKEHTDFGGLFRVESAVDLRDGDGQKFELQLEPDLSIDLQKDMKLKLIGRIRSDLLDHLVPGDPPQPEIAGPSRTLNLGDRV